MYLNESYIVKDGVRTTSIRPEGKKEKLIKISGLHPNTTDQAVIRYLSAHGTVNSSNKVIHHVYPGKPGSSVLAGKLDGTRSYTVNLKIPMASYHIIDGEKVSFRYSGQEWTCARCHQYKRNCQGAAVARDCTADQKVLSDFISEHWDKIGYQPDSDISDDVDENPDIIVGNIVEEKVSQECFPKNVSKYNAVIVKGFRAQTKWEDIKHILHMQGLPNDYDDSNKIIHEKNGSISLEHLEPLTCLNLTSNMNGKKFLDRVIYVSAVVSASPQKPEVQSELNIDNNDNGNLNQSPIEVKMPKKVVVSSVCQAQTSSKSVVVDSPSQKSVVDKISLLENQTSEFVFETPYKDNGKRKSDDSPENKNLSKKEKKLLKSEERKAEKLRKKVSSQVQVQLTHSN